MVRDERVRVRVSPDSTTEHGVKVSLEIDQCAGDVDALDRLHLLNAIQTCGFEKVVRFYQASTFGLYDKVGETPFYPRSPHSIVQMYGYWSRSTTTNIPFNHESPRGGRRFVTLKTLVLRRTFSCASRSASTGRPRRQV